MSEAGALALDAVDLTDEEYVVEQNLVRNKYRAYDGDGNVVLRAKQKLFRMKEEFPFVDADGEPADAVTAAALST